MKIAIFTDTYPPYVNGVSTSISMLEKGLKELGHEVYIVTANPNNARFVVKDHLMCLPSIKTNIYDYRISGTYSLRAAKQIQKWNIDIIHSHTEFGIGTFARFISQGMDIPLVHTYHTMYEDYRYYIFKGHLDKETDYALKYFIKYFCENTADGLIVPTKKIYNLFRNKYHMTRDINIIPTGLEIDRFYKENFDDKEVEKLKKKYKLGDSIISLYVGRLGKEKSVDQLIKAEKELKGINHKLLIIGDGPDADKYHELVKKYGLEKQVIFTGKIPYTNIPLYYQMGDILSTASITETQGLTVVEAMAASMPVVAVKDDAFIEAINNKNGYLYKDLNDYVKKIKELVNNPELIKKLGKQARIDSDKYSYQTYAKSVEKVYKEVLKEKGYPERNLPHIVGKVIKKGIKNEK